MKAIQTSKLLNSHKDTSNNLKLDIVSNAIKVNMTGKAGYEHLKFEYIYIYLPVSKCSVVVSSFILGKLC